MQDVLYRGVLDALNIRFAYALTTAVANRAVLAHNCDPLASHVLSRALGSGVLLSSLLNGDERYTMRWNYRGAVKTVLVDVDAEANVRGFIAPACLGESFTAVDEIYGDAGRVMLTKSNGQKTLNSGIVDARLLDIVDDLSYFFSISDQIETALVVMVSFCRDTRQPVSLCQGIMLQALPDCALTVFDGVRRRLYERSVRSLLAIDPQIDNHFELILRGLVGDEVSASTCGIAALVEPTFRCTCTREHMLEVIRALPDAELRDAAGKREDLRVTCRFCAREYVVSQAEMADAIRRGEQET